MCAEKRNSDLVISLHNQSLAPLEKCRLILTNLQRFSPAHNDFQRNPFLETLIIKPQTINAGNFSNEAVPLGAYQQTTKRTLLVFRSFPYESQVILLIELRIEGGGRNRSETKFISWTPGQDPEFIDDPRAKPREAQPSPFITPQEYVEQRKRLPDSEIMMKIWAKPRWCIWSRPEHFRKARFRDLDHCAQFVANASVHSSARWTQYPWFSSTLEYGDESITGEIELDDSEIKHLERWVLFRSGQFVHNVALDEMPVLSGRTHVLEILNMVTAVYEFIGRMADQKLISDRTSIAFEFQRVEGRQLTWPQDASQRSDVVDRNSWCQDESFGIDIPSSARDLINGRRELALEASLRIYSRFGWTDPPREELQKLQLSKFGHPRHV